MGKYRRYLITLLITLLAAGILWGLHSYFSTYIYIDGTQYRRDVQHLDLTGKPVEQLDRIMKLKQLQSLDLRGTRISAIDKSTLQEALPHCQIIWEPCFQGAYYSQDTRQFTISELTDGDVAYLDFFPQLETIYAPDCSDYEQLSALARRRPDCQVLYWVRMGDQAFDSTASGLTAADLTAQQAETLLSYLPRLKSLTLTGRLPDAADLTALTERYPNVDISWQLSLLGISLTSKTTDLDISGISVSSTGEVEHAIAYLPQLKTLTMCGCGLSNEDMAALRDSHPDIRLIWSISFGSATVRTDDKEINLSWNSLTVEQVENALPYFTDLEKVVMSNCGISNEQMDALNRRHENIQFVWTVYIQHVPIRTDISYFMPYKLSLKVRDKDLYNLRYCTEVICVDLGHMDVTSCEFASYMPHLKYLLLGDTMITDISPLKGLNELIYLELFMTYVKDYSPLLECPALEDLNICGTYGSPEPIAKLTWLKNLWWGGKYILSDAEDQVLRDSLPNTYLELETISSTAAGWRKLKNYYDMRDVLGMWYME